MKKGPRFFNSLQEVFQVLRPCGTLFYAAIQSTIINRPSSTPCQQAHARGRPPDIPFGPEGPIHMGKERGPGRRYAGQSDQQVWIDNTIPHFVSFIFSG